jgi:hypothetical protein
MGGRGDKSSSAWKSLDSSKAKTKNGEDGEEEGGE